jgi:hypothetical protein
VEKPWFWAKQRFTNLCADQLRGQANRVKLPPNQLRMNVIISAQAVSLRPQTLERCIRARFSTEVSAAKDARGYILRSNNTAVPSR